MMLRRSLPFRFLLASIGVYALDALYHLPLLPERMATHFGPTGRPDGWTDKGTFIVSGFALMALVTGLQAGIAVLLARSPNELINLPNKAFWLAPERRAQTIAILADQMLIFGVATNALLVAIFHQVFRANLMPNPQLGASTWITLAAYLVYTVVWGIGLTYRFRRP